MRRSKEAAPTLAGMADQTCLFTVQPPSLAIFTVTSIQPGAVSVSRWGIAPSSPSHPFRVPHKKGPAYRLGTMGGA
jgi:hypothetical protein